METLQNQGIQKRNKATLSKYLISKPAKYRPRRRKN